MFQPDEWQQKALKTWYDPGNPLHLDPRHPLIKQAGEAGELLDLYGKHEYKLGFSWWNCKHCGYGDASHSLDGNKRCPYLSKIEDANILRGNYTPLILDELGDWWYYLRIVTYQQEISIEEWVNASYPPAYDQITDVLFLLSEINHDCAKVLSYYAWNESLSGIELLHLAFMRFLRLLELLDCSLDHLTELNYRKLNSEPTAHGWKQ